MLERTTKRAGAGRVQRRESNGDGVPGRGRASLVRIAAAATVASAFVLALGLGGGWELHAALAGGPLVAAKAPVAPALIVREEATHYRFIHPLLRVEAGAPETWPELAPLYRALFARADEARKSGLARDVSIYYRRLDDGAWFGIDEDAVYEPASLGKVVRLVAWLRAAENLPGLLASPLTFTGASMDGMENIAVADHLVAGHAYTVDDLLRRMIALSDNDSLMLLDANLDPALLAVTIADLGLTTVPDRWGNEAISARAFSSSFRALYSATVLTPAMSDKALGLLADSDFHDGLVAGVPAGTRVAHKFGERTRVMPDGSLLRRELHDCGVIYRRGQGPYLLCVMTRGDDYHALETVIASLSKIAWDVSP